MGLLDQAHSFAQGASNGVAGSLTGPVDGLAWLLRKAGVPVPEAPMGGSDWMRNVGLMQEPKERIAGLLGEGIGLALPTVIAGKAPQIAGGLLQMERNAMAPRTLNPQTGAIVWHGSPHKFDKFDSSKIGTGEGAQAYGHGLYLAESPDVAKMYATGNQGRAAASDGLIDALPKPVQMDLYKAMNMRDGFIKDAMLDDIYKQYPAAKAVTQAKDAKLYKVDLPDELIAKMLDWDKPLSQQPQAFKDAVSAREQQRMMPILEQRRATLAGLPQGAENASILKKQIAILEDEITQPQAVPNMTGGEYFNYLRNREMAPAEQADWLRKAGIPGIRYLDGGSRGAGGGTSNFVVFPGNEGLLQILERNGSPIN